MTEMVSLTRVTNVVTFVTVLKRYDVLLRLSRRVTREFKPPSESENEMIVSERERERERENKRRVTAINKNGFFRVGCAIDGVTESGDIRRGGSAGGKLFKVFANVFLFSFC
jgi:hypothetical protein